MEDPLTKRRQPRNYLETLEKRVAFLEGLLERGQLSASVASTVSPTAENEGRSERPRPSKSHQQAVDDVDNLASKVGILSLNAFGSDTHYMGSSSTFAFSRLLSSHLRQNVSAGPAAAGSNLCERDATSPSSCFLPDYDTAAKLSHAYFENVHPQYPFLHEPTFRSWEAMHIWPSGTLDEMNAEPVPLFFLYIVCDTLTRRSYSRVMPNQI